MKKQFLIPLFFCTFQLLPMKNQELKKIYSLQEYCLRAVATNYASEFSKHMPELQELITSVPMANYKEKLLEFLQIIINKESPCHITEFPLTTKLTWLKFCSKALLGYIGSIAYFKDDKALITKSIGSFYYSHTIPVFFDAPVQCAGASILQEHPALVFAQDKSLLVRENDKTKLIASSESTITSLAFGSNLTIGYGNESGQIHLLSRKNLQELWQKIKTIALNTKITALAISPCSHYIIACDAEGTASFHGNAAYTELDQYSYCLEKETPTEYCFISPNGLLIGLQQQNSTILLFNLLRLMHGIYPYYFIADKKSLPVGRLLSFTPDNKLIVEKDNTLTLYNENGNALEEELSVPQDVIKFSAMPFHCRTQKSVYIPEYTNS